MHIAPEKFSRIVLASLAAPERERRLAELESLVNPTLTSRTTLPEFQEELYALIESLEALGHFLGRWEYDCEVEYWGGKSYMDKTISDELLLKSEFTYGVRLAWQNFEALNAPRA